MINLRPCPKSDFLFSVQACLAGIYCFASYPLLCVQDSEGCCMSAAPIALSGLIVGDALLDHKLFSILLIHLLSVRKPLRLQQAWKLFGEPEVHWRESQTLPLWSHDAQSAN